MKLNIDVLLIVNEVLWPSVMFYMQTMSENCRPKGLCGWRDTDMMILVMVGQVLDSTAMSSVFLPSSLTADYQLSLQLHSGMSPSLMSLLTYVP